MQSRNIQTRAIILNKKRLGEFDEIITFYTPTHGKISAIAKGAHKMTSHFCGHLEPLSNCKIQLYQTPYGFTVIQSVIEKNFKNIRKDLKISLLAMLCLEIFQKSTYIESSDIWKNLFDLLEKTLDQLNKQEQSFLVVESFKLQLLHQLGALPDISVCSYCQNRWTNESKIGINPDFHLTCGNCQLKNELPCHWLSFNMLKLIHFLLMTKNIQKQKIMLTRSEEEQLQKINNIFLHNYISNEIQSEKVMIQLSE